MKRRDREPGENIFAKPITLGAHSAKGGGIPPTSRPIGNLPGRLWMRARLKSGFVQGSRPSSPKRSDQGVYQGVYLLRDGPRQSSPTETHHDLDLVNQ